MADNQQSPTLKQSVEAIGASGNFSGNPYLEAPADITQDSSKTPVAPTTVSGSSPNRRTRSLQEVREFLAQAISTAIAPDPMASLAPSSEETRPGSLSPHTKSGIAMGILRK